MAWVFQGNPENFDVDDYVTRYPDLIYWRTPRHASQIAIGDRAIIWRSGPDAGAIALGVVVEAPTPGTKVRHPEALRNDLWRTEEPDPDENKTGIQLHDIRLNLDEGYLPRQVAKSDAELASATIITMPNGTVFPLTVAQTAALERLWGRSTAQVPEDALMNVEANAPNLAVLSDANEIAAAQAKFRAVFEDASDRTGDLQLGYQGGAKSAPTYFVKAENIWGSFKQIETRYWTAFGIGDPFEDPKRSIVVEINSPLREIDRRVGGAFVKDPEGNVSLVHRGRIGGGRENIGKSGLLGVVDPVELVKFQDGERTSEAILIGRLDEPGFLGKVARFVRKVQEFKLTATRSTSVAKQGMTSEIPSKLDVPDMNWLAEKTLWPISVLEELCSDIRTTSPQVVLAGPPGTGKTWVAKHIAKYLTKGNSLATRVVQFHPSYGYEEFMQGLRPVVDERTGSIRFAIVDGVVIRMAKQIAGDDQLHVLIVDEMNRANLPRVLGELMYLFDYRDQEEAIDLQYSADFALPSNLKFICTMNTADRSIRSIDNALRRRFEIFECLPDRRILEQYYSRRIGNNQIASLFDGFEQLNERLAAELDRHHTIGHTFFMAPDMTPSRLRKVWKYKLGPLIEEYFFDQADLAAEFSPDKYWPELLFE